MGSLGVSGLDQWARIAADAGNELAQPLALIATAGEGSKGNGTLCLPAHEDQLAGIRRSIRTTIKVCVHLFNGESYAIEQVFHLELEGVSHRERVDDSLNGPALVSDVVDELVVIHLGEAITLEDARSTDDGPTIRQRKLWIAIELHAQFLAHQHLQ